MLVAATLRAASMHRRCCVQFDSEATQEDGHATTAHACQAPWAEATGLDCRWRPTLKVGVGHHDVPRLRDHTQRERLRVGHHR